jgi:hypothetical protein
MRGVGRAPYEFANLPRKAHFKFRSWPLRLGIGHEDNKLILKIMIMLRSSERK